MSMQDSPLTEGGVTPKTMPNSSPPPAVDSPRRQRSAALPKFQAGWIREVAERSRTARKLDESRTTTGATGGPVRPAHPASGLGPRPSGDSDVNKSLGGGHQAKHFRREYAFYCTPRGMIPGMLAISEQLITFEPDRRGQEVRRTGVGDYQVVIPISMVSETAAVVLPRTHAIEGLFNLPEDRTDKQGMELPSWASSQRSEEEDPAIGLLQILLRNCHNPAAARYRKRISPDKTDRRRSYSPASQLASVVGRKVDRSDTKSSVHMEQQQQRVTFSSRASDGSMDSNQSSRRRSAARLADMNQVPGRMRRRSGTLDPVTVRALKKVPSERLSLIDTPAPPPDPNQPSSGGSALGTTIDQAAAGGTQCRRPNHPQSFVLFRVGSTTAVREVTRLLLDIIDEHNAAAAKRNSGSLELAELVETNNNSSTITTAITTHTEQFHSNPAVSQHHHHPNSIKDNVSPPVFVPYYSNHSLDLLMTLCLDTVSSPQQSDGLHGPSSSEQASDGVSGSHGPSTESLAWLFRASPPKLDMPEGAVAMLTESMSLQLSAALPPTVALRKWTLLFDTNLHGVSLLSFYRHTEGHAPSLVLIRDESNNCFGGYNPDGFKDSRHYYGSGEAFVFTFKKPEKILSQPPRSGNRVGGEPLSIEDSGGGGGGNNGPILQVFPWSGANSFFVYSDCERIMFGGGGSYAFAIDADLLQGNTSKCSTFGNTALTTSEDFVVREMQVWGFEPF